MQSSFSYAKKDSKEIMFTHQEIQDFCQAFSSEKNHRYVFGLTEYGMDIARAFPLAGFIDDKTSATAVNGVPVVKLSQLPRNALVVSGIADGRPITAQHILAGRGLRSLDYFSFYAWFSARLSKPAFLHGKDFHNDYQRHNGKYQWVRSVLADEESVATFDKLVKFRLSNDLSDLEGFHVRLNEQYFDLPMAANYTSHFVDCGSFDGATSLLYAQHYPDYKEIHVFEPEPKQFAHVKENLQGTRGVSLYPFAVSDRQQRLRFSTLGSASHISKNGDMEIEARSLDSLLKGKVSWIKLDVEGYESQALAGAKKIIQTQHPLLAVCCYHKPDDLWRLPEQVLSYRSDYQLYLRHYTEGLLETVYYFVPVTQ
jgi:FkbM family methyltransferase